MRRPWRLYPLVLIFVLGVTPKALAQKPTFTRIDFPGATSTNAYDINDSGEIVGRYTNADDTQHGYLRSPNGELTPIDVPGANLTAALGINSGGDIVGPYRLASEPMNSRHGFLLSNGQFTTFDFPGAFFTQPVGINDYGDIVGRYCTVNPCGQPGSSNWHGFLLHEGEFTSIDFPEALQRTAWKINAS